MSSDFSTSPAYSNNVDPMNAPWLFDDEDARQNTYVVTTKKKKKPRLFNILSFILLVGTVAGIVAIGTRIDYQKIDPEPPSSTEKERQELAVQTSRILSASTRNGLDNVTSHAERWIEMLGGVWQPWPDGNIPEGRTNPPYETEAPATADTAYVIDQLIAVSNTATEQASAYSDESRQTLLRIAIDAKLCAARVAEEADMDAPVGGTVDITHVAEAAQSETLIALSQARQWLEKEASSVDVSNSVALSARIERITSIEEAILARGIDDKRPAVSAIPELKDGQSLTNVALSHIVNALLDSCTRANGTQIRAIVTYTYSLYMSDRERAEADLIRDSQ